MNSYIVLFQNELNDENLFNATINQFSDWAQLIPNHAWQIITNDSKSTEVRFKILESMKRTQQPTVPFIVINVTKSGWASHKIDQEITDWLKKDR